MLPEINLESNIIPFKYGIGIRNNNRSRHLDIPVEISVTDVGSITR